MTEEDARPYHESAGSRPTRVLRPLKRRAILVAARALFLGRGYALTGMEDVAQRAGVSIKTVYRHFPGKDLLFAAVMADDCGAVAGSDGGNDWQALPLKAALFTVGRVYLTSVLSAEELALYRVVALESVRAPQLGLLYVDANLRARERALAAYLQTQHEAGVLHAPNPLNAAGTFAGLLRAGMFEPVLFGERPTPTEPELTLHVRARVRDFTSLLKGGRATESMS